MKRLIALLVASTLTACTVGPSYRRPPVTVPDQFYGQTGSATAESLADQKWSEVFRDPALQSLIEEALRNSYNTQIAAARVEEARARYGISGSERLPQLTYSGEALREHTSTFATPSDVTGGLLIAQVNVSWEIDLWGRIRRLNEAAKAQYLATEEARRGVILSLIADVATAYFDLRQLDDELAIARRATANFQDTFDLFNHRLAGGAASALETSRAEASLANEAAEIPLLESAIVAKENQIDLLAGRAPGHVERDASFETLAPPAIPPGLPSALLLRRPDVREAEEQLIAANANIGAAQAAFYPTLSLTGLLGGQSPQLSELLNSGKTWTIEAGVLGPIFNAGLLRNQQRLAVAEFQEAELRYEYYITSALGEVSTSLVALQKLAESESQRQRAVKANQEAVRLANLRYDSGLSAYFEVLDAMEQELTAENALAQTRRDRLAALVNFYRALGGGWEEGKPEE